MTTLQTLCMGCMTDKGTVEVCPRCGFVESDQPISPAHLPPRTLLQARYVVGRVLGEGGFGITYLGWDETLALRVAIKEFLPHYLAARNGNGISVRVYQGEQAGEFAYGLERFLDEARRLARFADHSGIVAARDFFTAHHTGYLVMNYLEGITFQEHLARQGGRIPLDQALQILSPVMDALREVHAVGLLHRDISPDNLFLPTGKPAKLIDFGAARAALGEHSRSLSVIVKPGYAPEEQYRSRGQQGPWTDIYALGATFYCALTGQRPPPAPDRFYQDTLLPPSALDAVLSPAVESVLLQALAVRAERRFQTVAEFQAALEKAMEKAGVGDRALAATPSVTPTAPPVGAESAAARSEVPKDRYWLAEKLGQNAGKTTLPAAVWDTPRQYEQVLPKTPTHWNFLTKRFHQQLLIAGLAGSLLVGGFIGLAWWYHGESKTLSLSSFPPVELPPRDVAASTPTPEDTQSSPLMAAAPPGIGPSFDCRKAAQ